MFEQKLQMIVQYAVRTIGPILLRGGLGGGGAAGTTPSRSKIDDDFDDFDDDDNEVDTKKKDDEKVSISLPTFKPDSVTATTTLAESARINLLDSVADTQSTSTQKTPSQTTEDELSFRKKRFQKFS